MGSAGFLCDTVFRLKVLQHYRQHLSCLSLRGSKGICCSHLLPGGWVLFLGLPDLCSHRDCFPRPWATLLLMSFTEFALRLWALSFSLQGNSESRHAVSLLSMHYISNLWWIPFVFLQNNWKAFGKWSRQSIRKLTHQNSPGLQELGRRNMQLHLTSES